MNTTKISKLLSLVLRHKPETIGVDMDIEGWVEIKQLLRKLKDFGSPLTWSELSEIVSTNNKKRFKINDKGTHIRASQGHSVNINLKLEPKNPPATLYHGTSTKSLDSIFKHGITKQSRQHVHMSLDYDTAVKVGKRHGNVIILLIDSEKMHEDGNEFFLSDNNVWLTDKIDPKYITILHSL